MDLSWTLLQQRKALEEIRLGSLDSLLAGKTRLSWMERPPSGPFEKAGDVVYISPSRIREGRCHWRDDHQLLGTRGRKLIQQSEGYRMEYAKS